MSGLFAEENTEIKAQHISLPAGPGSLEGLGKAFEPSLNTGGASYSVAIAVPPGPVGHTPEIALNYSSGFGQGMVGLGWQISLPSVERSLENGQPLYSDEDVLTYDGETLVALTDSTYAPAVQSSFIRFSRDENRFIAEDKAGNQYEFGVVEDGLDNTAASTGPDISEFNGTFRWYLKKLTDAKGQSTEYFYRSFDDSPGVLYLDKIQYGITDGNTNTVQFEYQTRPDGFDNYQAGFAQTTAQRLGAVSVYHGLRALWHYDLSYDLESGDSLYPDKDQAALSSGLSVLRKVTRWDGQRSVSLPPIRFEYSQIYAHDVDLEPLGNFPSDEDVDLNGNGVIDDSAVNQIAGLPSGVNVMGQQASFTDVTRDGLPDWLYWRSGEYFLAKNLGYSDASQSSEVSFAAGEVLSNVPVAPLDDDSVHLIDLDGDGQADFLHGISDTQWLFYRNQGNGHFAVPVAYDAPPSIRPGEAGVQFADINMDQRIDIISSSGGYWRYCLNGPSNLQAGYHATTYDTDFAPFGNFPGPEDVDINGNSAIDLPAWQCSGSLATTLPADINFTNDDVKLADINGDRLKDVVWLRSLNGKIHLTYWPHKGQLGFGEARAIELGSPDAAGLELAKLRLSDVNGDGMADLLYIQPGQVRFWLQQHGVEGIQWSAPQGLTAPNYNLSGTAIFDGDINGNGTADFIWVSVDGETAPQYLDLSGDTKANLLSLIDNGMGLRTQLSYTSMGGLQAEAEQANRPWQSSSPIAQQVVTKRSYFLPLDTTGSGQHDRIEQTYRYRDAYYDPYKKQFRGFAFARVETLGDAAQGTQVSRHFFHTGAPDGQDNDGDGLVDEREVDGSTEELPLKGLSLALEQTAQHIDLADNETAAAEQLVQAQSTRWQLRRIHSIDTDVASMTGKEVTFVEKRQEQVSYNEFTAAPPLALKEHRYDDQGNPTETIEYGLLDSLDDDKITTFQYASPVDGLFQLPSKTTVTDASGNLLSDTETYYDHQGLHQLTRGLATSEKRWKEGSTWITSQTSDYDPYGNPILLIDGDGRRTQLVWDEYWHAYPIEEWIFANGSSETPLRIKADYDTGLGTLQTYTGVNGEQTHLGYDYFGRLLSLTKPNDSEPTVQYSYHFVDPFRDQEYQFSSEQQQRISNVVDSTSFVYTRLTRDDGRTEEVRGHIDGLGRELATYTKDETGYIVTDSQWFDHQGREVKTFRPWRSELTTFMLPDNDLIATETVLDAHGRPVTEIFPSDDLGRHAIRQYQYSPRAVRAIDPDLFESVQTFDSEDRVLSLNQQQHIDGELTWQLSRFLYDPLGRLVSVTDAHNNLKTQGFNGLDHKVSQSDLDQGETFYEFDNAGNLDNKIDALGRRLYYKYDQAGRLLSISDHQLQPLYAYHYDVPQVATGLDGYLGKLAWVEEFDPESGISQSEHFHYDLRGNVIHKTRVLDSVPYQFHYQYDQQDRIVRQVWPDGDSAEYQYGLRGKIKRIVDIIDDVQYHEDDQVDTIYYANGTQQSRQYDHKGQLTELQSKGTETLQLLSYGYDLRGNITSIDDVLASQNSQSYQYDAGSQLLTATGGGYGQLRYQYDAIGNMTAKYWDHASGGTLHNLGVMTYGGSAGTRDRVHKGGQAGPHAITGASTSTSDGQSWQYNGIGQRISDSTGSVFNWDQMGRLTQWQQAHEDVGGDTVITAQEKYRYDFKGRRLSKVSYQVDEGTGQLATASQAFYVDKSYEVRDDQTQKHLFLGSLRVARLDTPVAQAFQQIKQYSLAPGWNSVYLPIEPEGSSLIQQLGELVGNATEVVNFNAPAQQYQQYQQAGASSLDRLQASQVYWLNLTDNSKSYPLDWQVAGLPEPDQPGSLRLLSSGWNQTTLPVAADTDTEHFTEGTAIERIWAYQQDQDRWYGWQKNDPDTAALQTLTSLNPETIYWVYSSRAQVVSSANGINSEKYFIHNNHLGSVALTIDSAGAVTVGSQYQPYGAVSESIGDLGKQPYGFSGKELDGSGLHYFEARYYDAITARFISPDPLFAAEMGRCIGSIIECNLYQYTGNNPVNYTDLNGLETNGSYINSGPLPQVSFSSENKFAELAMAPVINGSNLIRSAVNVPLNVLGAVGNAIAPHEGAIFSASQAIHPGTGAAVGYAARGLVALGRAGKVAKAAGNVPGRVQSRINLANGRTKTTPLRNSGDPVSAGFDHVLDGHFNRALGNNRSVFSVNPGELKSILQSKAVVNSPATSIGGGQFSRTVNVGTTIGNASIKQGGGATSTLRVLTDRAGNLITTYPVR